MAPERAQNFMFAHAAGQLANISPSENFVISVVNDFNTINWLVANPFAMSDLSQIRSLLQN